SASTSAPDKPFGDVLTAGLWAGAARTPAGGDTRCAVSTASGSGILLLSSIIRAAICCAAGSLGIVADAFELSEAPGLGFRTSPADAAAISAGEFSPVLMSTASVVLSLPGAALTGFGVSPSAKTAA